MRRLADYSAELGDDWVTKESPMCRRALIIEESAVARSILGILLQRSGWEVIGAADGAEAVKLASTWHFDLVITVPEPSKVPGLQLVQLLKGDLLSPRVRIILQVEPREAGHEIPFLGLVDDFLLKDGRFDEKLHGKLSQWFGSMSSRMTRRIPRKRATHRKPRCAS
jgi:CheY-like chemotaxis protein